MNCNSNPDKQTTESNPPHEPHVLIFRYYGTFSQGSRLLRIGWGVVDGVNLKLLVVFMRACASVIKLPGGSAGEMSLTLALSVHHFIRCSQILQKCTCCRRTGVQDAHLPCCILLPNTYVPTQQRQHEGLFDSDHRCGGFAPAQPFRFRR